MEGEASAAIARVVEKTTHDLEDVSVLLKSEEEHTIVEESITTVANTLTQDVEALQAITTCMGSQRVLALSATQVMESGIFLYNKSRTTFKALQSHASVGTSDPDAVSPADQAHLRFLVLMARCMATRIMGLAHSCSRSGTDGNGSNQATYLDECLDVIRSYGRVGSLLLESASMDGERCTDYLARARETLDSSMAMWAQVGLTCLTKFKQDLELEEILQDLWDFCIDRIRVVRLLYASGDTNRKDDSKLNTIVETLRELQLLLPYMTANVKSLLSMGRDLSDEWRRAELHHEQGALIEEMLRLCDTIENPYAMVSESTLFTFKEHFLQNLLHSLRSIGDVEKAEACFSLMKMNQNASAILTMVKLYVEQNELTKAATSLHHLFQVDDVRSALTGARIYAEALSFSEDSLQVYQELERNYGEDIQEIKLEMACGLASSESRETQRKGMEEIKKVGDTLIQMSSKYGDAQLINRIQQVLFDTTQNAYNAGDHELCVEWADLGVKYSQASIEKAVFMRIISSAYTKLQKHAEAWKWAEAAFHQDQSKKSMLAMFQVALMSGSDNDDTAIQVVRQLRERDDFDACDLIAFGSAANSVKKREICLLILDELCMLVSENLSVISGLPLGVLLQNTAQLAYQVVTQTGSTTCESQAVQSYADKFCIYAGILLRVADNKPCRSGFGPPSVFTWFYGMSFNIAKGCSSPQVFVTAADIAQRSGVMFGEESPLLHREGESLLAAISSAMKTFATIDPKKLEAVLNTIIRYEAIVGGSMDGAISEYLAKCVFAIKLRLFEGNVDALMQLCQAKLGKNVDTFIELGELVLFSTKFDEATSIRSKYRGLARDLFKYGLQFLLQSDASQHDKISYLFRRMITLAASRKHALEWFGQLLQLSESLEVTIPVAEAEWFVCKAWNMGVQQYRSDCWETSQKFMKMSLALLVKLGGALDQLSVDLHRQYESVVASNQQSRVFSGLVTNDTPLGDPVPHD